MKDKSKNKKEYKTLLSALAFGATDEAQKILATNGMKESNTYEELEYNLAKLYANSTDKISLEKEFAKIHPHSKFILKYLAPKVPTVDKQELDEGNVEYENTPPKIVEMTSSANGSCSCGCSSCSSAEGTIQTPQKIDYNVLALVSVVAIVGLVIIAKK
jgi:hypothetical protein